MGTTSYILVLFTIRNDNLDRRHIVGAMGLHRGTHAVL